MLSHYHSSALATLPALEKTYGCNLYNGPCSIKGEEKQPFKRIKISRKQALDPFSDNKFKVELINDLSEDKRITVYRYGPLVDLCRGPHIPNTSFVRAFECLKLQKCIWELSSLRDRDEEMTKKWWDLNNEVVKTKDVKNEKIKHLEEVNKTRDDEILKQKLETKQWNKMTKDTVLFWLEMSIGKTRKDLDDCRMATYLDHGFLKVCLIAGNYHLVHRELDEALCSYKKCFDSGMVCLDRRLTIEASDGLQSVEDDGLTEESSYTCVHLMPTGTAYLAS
ncbi:DnaJ domain, zinc finger, CCHC-type, tetratricopeptide-like helical domain protein [Tanacetum coccineum]